MSTWSPPNTGQIALLLAAMVLFLAGAAVSLARLWSHQRSLRLVAKSLDYFAVLFALAALIWHCALRGNWLPLGDNFEAFGALGILLALFWLYVQRARPIPGLDWFLIPIVVLMLLSAVVFGRMQYGVYHSYSVWFWTHLLSSFAGAFAFAVAAAVGGMYLLVSARLRRKTAGPGPNLGNLERLENVTQTAATLGFALLTLGMLTGVIKILQDRRQTSMGKNWLTSPKVLLAFAVWIIYAMALHTPITPAVRGRKSALLSIVGFILMFGVLVAAQYMPSPQ